MLLLIVQKLLNKFVEVRLDRIQENIALGLKWVAAFFQRPLLFGLKLVPVLTLTLAKSDPLLRINNHHKRHQIGEFARVE